MVEFQVILSKWVPNITCLESNINLKYKEDKKKLSRRFPITKLLFTGKNLRKNEVVNKIPSL